MELDNGTLGTERRMYLVYSRYRDIVVVYNSTVCTVRDIYVVGGTVALSLTRLLQPYKLASQFSQVDSHPVCLGLRFRSSLYEDMSHLDACCSRGASKGF